MNDQQNTRLLSLSSGFFMILAVFVLVAGTVLYFNLSRVEDALPVQSVNQFRDMSGLIPLLSNLSADLDSIQAGGENHDLGKLGFTIRKIESSCQLVNQAFAGQAPEDLATLLDEIAFLTDDIARYLEPAATMDQTAAILFRNRTTYVYSELRDYILRVNNDTLVVLETQGTEIGRLRLAMILSQLIVVFGMVLTFILLRYQKNLLLQVARSRDLAISYSRAKSDFLSSMTHEIRTPLNAILGYSQILLREESHSAETLRELEIINSSGEHLLDLINHILEMAKIEAGKVDIAREPCSLGSLFRQLENLFELGARKKGLQFQATIGPDLPDSILTDPAKFKQILINLVGNAIKFTDQGSVRLTAARPPTRPDLLLCTISDTGPGIPPESIGRIFSAFEQTSEGRGRGGTGLGLSISLEYARLLGGDLSVESKLGEGSRFQLTLPLVPAPSQPGEGLEHAGRIIGIAGGAVPRILIVDDRAVNRDILVRMLSPLGFPVQEAASGNEALDLVQSWKPDLLLLDLIMPGLGGREVLQTIRSNPAMKHLVLFVITASAMESERQEVLDLGANAFIRKPFRELHVLQEIGRTFGLEYVWDLKHPAELVPEVLSEADLKARLEGLPPALLARLTNTLRLCDVQELNTCVEELTSSDQALANHIKLAVDEFEFGPLLEIIKTLKPGAE